MTNRPFISVVIPTYNRHQQVIAAMESVLAQTYANFEIIVVDDGSTDGSGEAVQQFISQRTNRDYPMYYFSQPNQGPSVARNTGIAKAQGEYIAFLDSDDIWFPEKLEWQVRAIEQFKNGCGVCFTDTRYVNNLGMDTTTFRWFGRHYGQTIGIERDSMMLLAKSFAGFWLSALLAKSDLIRQIGGFDPGIHFAEDRDFCFRLSLVTSFAYVNKPLVRTDRSSSPPGSTCRPWDKMEVQFRGQQSILEKWLRMDTAMPPDVRRTVVRGLRCQHSQWANWHLENSRYHEARQAISRAVKYELTPGLAVKWVLTWLVPALARRITPKVRRIGTLGHAS